MFTFLTFQYTLTETHLGGAGTDGAVDLPIVRESTTDLPFLPDTSLKGCARATAREVLDTTVERWLFGRAIGENSKDAESKNPTVAESKDPKKRMSDAGKLTFTQGHLLLFPLRSLQSPFVYATCPLLLSRLVRMLRAFYGKSVPLTVPRSLCSPTQIVKVSGAHLGNCDLVVEGAAFTGSSVLQDKDAGVFAARLATLFPQDESDTGDRISRELVVLPDADFVNLVRSAPPVRARIAIDSDTGTTSGAAGNLWYEEMLPSDCLFWSIVQLRDKPSNSQADALSTLLDAMGHCQIGAGASAGHGHCWWWRAEAGQKNG